MSNVATRRCVFHAGGKLKLDEAASMLRAMNSGATQAQLEKQWCKCHLMPMPGAEQSDAPAIQQEPVRIDHFPATHCMDVDQFADDVQEDPVEVSDEDDDEVIITAAYFWALIDEDVQVLIADRYH